MSAATDKAESATREALRAPFPADKVYQRQGPGGKKLDFISIETVLNRLLDAAPGYSWVASAQINYPESYIDKDGDRITPNPIVATTGTLSIDGKSATGFGSHQNPDLDMALKSANSEAMKNAAKNGWGVMLELWDAEYRDDLEKNRKIQTASEASLKGDVFRIARERLGKDKPTAVEIGTLFGVDPSLLTDVPTLRAILVAA
jgi:hypothetical protein